MERALDARPPAVEGRVGYREEIHHPAMAAPEVARGWFARGRDGELVRHQSEPQAETLEIGERFVRLSRESDGYSNTVPIPADLAPYLRILRALVADDRAGLSEALEGFDRRFEAGKAGWTVSLTARDGAGGARQMVLAGCGDLLRSAEWRLPDGSRRRYLFAEAP
ncbi:MAG: hypothetical protein WD100_05490 [Tistlia sp.]